MKPTMPRLSEGQVAFDEYWKALEEWDASPEGQAEKKREAEELAIRLAKEDAAHERARVSSAERLLEEMRIPPRALAAACSNPGQTDAVAASAGSRDMLVLSGAPGCGKTVAAALWLVLFVREKENWSSGRDGFGPRLMFRAPVWVTAARLARWERYDEDKMQELLLASRLVVDDLGGEYMDKGGFYASLLDELINERQAHSRPTILTTNLDADAFKARYGERIADRIREGGRFVACGNKSLRRKQES